MAQALRKLTARFVLSLSDVSDFRQVFEGIRFIDARVSDTIAGGRPLSTG
jgi:hypothetical protein